MKKGNYYYCECGERFIAEHSLEVHKLSCTPNKPEATEQGDGVNMPTRCKHMIHIGQYCEDCKKIVGVHEKPEATEQRERDEAIKELTRLEKLLITEIADTDNQVLMDVFLDWQQQRTLCNEKHNEWLNNLIQTKGESL